MVIGTRLRSLREEKGLSQGDIEKSTGLLRCYISRIENGHTIPSLETLERFAGALDVPLYKMFFSGEGEASHAQSACGARAWMSWLHNRGKPGRKRALCFSSRTCWPNSASPTAMCC